ncbi:MAG: acetylxylan esterase [Bacteroidales bacterium]|nr:MAG: acetylxylan esterase [Bacteroidales bacterium]
MKLLSLILFFWLYINICSISQSSDNQYRKPLIEVLDNIEIRFNVNLEYSSDLVKDLWLENADWRFRPDLEKTLNNVLLPLDLMYVKKDQTTYKIRKYRYARITVEDGREILDYLSSLYNDIHSWEKRKNELRQCMFKALSLSTLPEKPESKPVIKHKRKMNGYSVQNIAIETLPGLYVCGSLYSPLKQKEKVPVILCPNGHFEGGRYRDDQQYRCAMLARMGAVAVSYDLFAWGESLLQFKPEDHHRSLAMTIQALNSIRILDYLLSLKNVDTSRVGITGASGGGSQTMLISALDDRIKVSVPVVMLSSYFYGGCPCESGKPVHLCGNGTNNVEIAGMAAPRAQLVISDGEDWTAHVPEIEYPYLQKIYGYYGKEGNVQNIHFPDEGHDYGYNKRIATYDFMARHLGLNISAVKDRKGNIDESDCIIEEESELYVFGKNGEDLPAYAIKKFEDLEDLFNRSLIE